MQARIAESCEDKTSNMITRFYYLCNLVKINKPKSYHHELVERVITNINWCIFDSNCDFIFKVKWILSIITHLGC